MMNNALEDPLSDEVGRLILAMNAIPTWTREKKTIHEKLLKRLEAENYYFFQGSSRIYPIFMIGTSLLYKVPENKTGHLTRFRGKTIRLLRVASGGFNVGHFAAKELMGGCAAIATWHEEKAS